MMRLASAEPGWEWWEERLDIGEWKRRDVGSREVMAVCPVHGGGSLHVSEAGERVLIKCFGCDATYADIKESVELGEPDEPDSPGSLSSTPATIPLRTVRTSSASSASSTNASTRAQSSTVAMDPLEWTAGRCGMTLAELVALALPLEARGQRVAFTFGSSPGVKLRGQGEGKRKDILWEGGYTPPLWPVPFIPQTEIVLCEGEFDAITLRGAGLDAYSITGGAGSVPDVATFRALRDMGVERVHVLFDEDPAGRKGRDAVLEAIREAGIETVSSRVVGIEPLLGEKDVRDVALRIGAANVSIEDATSDDVFWLGEVPAVKAESLLVGYLHPSEHTILYGAGGTGKGVIAAWWAAELVAENKCVLIVDYEAHAQHEWRPRMEAFLAKRGMAKRIDTHVAICQPTEPIWEIGDWLRDLARRVQADYVIVDSVTYAVVGEEAESSKTAIRYSGAIARLGLPVLSLGHVTKADANPIYPFGSVFWHNGARVTIAISRTGPEPTAPRKLTNYKSNQRAEFKPQAVAWDWVDQRDEPPDELVFTDIKEEATATFERVYDALEATFGRPPTRAELSAHPDLSDRKAATLGSDLSRLRARREGPKMSMKSQKGAGA